jgi:hypothetical protein
MRLLKYCDFLLEERSELKAQMRYSAEMKSKLNKIGGKVAEALLDLEMTEQEFTYIDLGERDNTITFIEVDKVFDYLKSKQHAPGYLSRFIRITWLSKEDARHVELKIGKFAKSLLFDTFTDPEYGEFVDKWRALKDVSTFELWKGRDIMDAYRSDNYETCSGSTLDNSCMNDSEYIIFYSAIEGCEVLVLLDEDRSYGPTIKGRALVWTDYKGRRIMDRVYYNFSKDYQKFLNWAKENNVYYKKHNGTGGPNIFVLGDKEEKIKTKIKVPNVFTYRGDGFPYMDTFCYAQGEWVMNYEPEPGDQKFYLLQDTDGEYEEFNTLLDIYNEEIEDVSDYVFSKYQNGYIWKGDAIHLDYDGGDGFESYSFEGWLESEFVETGIPHYGKKVSFVEIDGKWYFQKHCVYSEKEGQWIWRPDAFYNNGDWISFKNFNPGK